MSPMPEDTANEIPLFMDTYSDDDESTLASERDDDRDGHDYYRLDLDSDDASSSSSSVSGDFSFVLDMGLVERSRQHGRSRTCVPSKEETTDILETDSLKLIRQRVSAHEKDQVRAVTPASSSQDALLLFKKMSVHSSFVDVCEVPLGVSLKEILPSTLYYSSSSSGRSRPTFQQLVRDTNRSESVLDDIEKALEILAVKAN
jgi:hypothetical protein